MAETTVGIMCGDEGCRHLTQAEARAIYEAAMREKAERQVRLPDEKSAIRAMFDGWARLKELGWRDASYAPRNTPLDVIEVGSTGIHYATRDEERRFWIHDDDTWPANPCLFRPHVDPAAPTPEG